MLSDIIDIFKFSYEKSGTSDPYPCSVFILEQMYTSYNFFRVPFLKEAYRLHTAFREAGFSILWQGLFWKNRHVQIMKNRTTLVGCTECVKMQHLEKFTATWATASGMCVFVLIFELGYTNRRTILETYIVLKFKLRIAYVQIMSVWFYYFHEIKIF